MTRQHKTGRARVALLSLAAVVTLAMVSAGTAHPQPPATPCSEPLATGFRPLDDSFWDGPWAFDTRGSSALRALDNSKGEATNGPIPIRLDDGRVATLRVESRPCGPAEDCNPYDCGCPLERDSYWIEIADAPGRMVARLHLWAAYGKFQIVPVDLVDGPGDELLIVRVPNHSSPPIGYDLKIWKVGETKPIDLGTLERVANLLGTDVIGCARWRTFMSIDTAAAKPRSIELRTELASRPCCRIIDEDTRRIANLGRLQVVPFDAVRRKYVFPGPAFALR